VPDSNHLGQRLEWPTVLEANVLGRGHVQQQLYTCKLTNRPPGLQPVGVSVHGIAVGNPPLSQWVEALPRSAESLSENVTIMCMDVVTTFDELQRRLEGAKALKVKASTVVAWVNYLKQLNDDLTVDDEALSQWAAMGPARVVPVAVARTAVSPTDDGVAAALSNTFAHDRTGNAAVRQRLPAEPRTRDAQNAPLVTTVPEQPDLAVANDTGLDDLEVILPVAREEDAPNGDGGNTDRDFLVQQLTAERRLVFASGGHGAKVIYASTGTGNSRLHRLPFDKHAVGSCTTLQRARMPNTLSRARCSNAFQ
jgi:hypothetical protein